MILLIDNYDSFAHNLARYFERLGQRVKVVRNDAIDITAIRQLAPQAIVLSPGPCTPNDAGCSLDIVRQLHTELPILGICLGHQTIAAALGAKIVRAATPMHGRTSLVEHRGTELFQGIPTTFTVCRYHSLVVDPASLPDELKTTATCKGGTIMALHHRSLPLFGLQFHPEAILTEHGFELLRNFLKLAGLPVSPVNSSLVASELRRPTLATPQLPQQPVTF
ncbi:MAG: aminodeoxychorismate/anthranilate synthase component II [Planctomycetes bacterium]|nr:aminodeoxychorismate/anthranilate synthase component II [Planctomycetota bacterium]